MKILYLLALDELAQCIDGWGKEHARLDIHQRCRHHQEFSGDGKVEGLHDPDIVEILLGNQGNRYVVDIDLILLDEMQQEVQGPLEDINLDGIGFHGYSPSASLTSTMVHLA